MHVGLYFTSSQMLDIESCIATHLDSGVGSLQVIRQSHRPLALRLMASAPDIWSAIFRLPLPVPAALRPKAMAERGSRLSRLGCDGRYGGRDRSADRPALLQF